MSFEAPYCANFVQIEKGLNSIEVKTLSIASDSGAIRTRDLLLRRQLLYPAELRNQ